MSEINELIKKRLLTYPAEVQSMALKAIALSESGLAESTIAEQLNNVAKQIIKKKGV